MKMYVEEITQGLCNLVIDFSLDGKKLIHTLDANLLSNLLTRKEIKRNLTRKQFNISTSSLNKIIVKSLDYNDINIIDFDFPFNYSLINFKDCDIHKLVWNSGHDVLFEDTKIDILKIEKPLKFIIMNNTKVSTLISLYPLNDLLISHNIKKGICRSVISHMDIPYIQYLGIDDDNAVIGSFYGCIYRGDTQCITNHSMSMGKYHINGCYRDISSLSTDAVLYMNKAVI